ncbi:MAG TPA: IspD/TarI family cytidylyltransferase [Treponemataceae bacterium]|nr:IspD/TarI family cytidylyltransferase [Treponemataceae bacterium]
MNALVLTAAGSSTRMGGHEKKEYLTLSRGPEGRVSVLSQSLHAFLSTNHFSIIVITVPKDGEGAARAVLAEDARIETLLAASKASLSFAEGGATRQASVLCGLERILEERARASESRHGLGSEARDDDAGDLVLVHDAARPFVSKGIIEDVLKTASERGAAVPAIPPVDTLKEVDGSGRITRHLDRASIAAVQTPQGFRLDALVAAHRKASLDGKAYTDDTEIWGAYAGDVWTCPGARENRKITYPGDLP